MKVNVAYELVDAELTRQQQKWKRAPGDWTDGVYVKNTVLGEEVGEVAHAVLEKDWPNLREELVQVAAVCINWLMSDFEQRHYNPNFGDRLACICGHEYYRHFDSHNMMAPVGCKYCMCSVFDEPEGN